MVPSTDVQPKSTQMWLVPEDDALRDRWIAEYEARLRANWAQPMVEPEKGYDEPDPVATSGAGLLLGAGHSHLLHPGWVIRPTQLAVETMDRSWARHKQRAQ